MAPPRTFDYDVLNQVIRDHPAWSNQQYADVMTQFERRVRGDPGYPPVKANAIARAISQMRTTWEAEGRPVRDRPYGRLIPWPGIPQDFIMDTSLRHLKTLEKARLGQPVSVRDHRQALAFEDRLRRQRRVVDIRANGKPFERIAEPHELDASGRLIKLTADVRPEWLAKMDDGGIESREDYLTKLEDRHARQAPVSSTSARRQRRAG